MPVSRVALAAMTILCGSAFLMSPALGAQQPPAPTMSLSREERSALQALALAASGTDRAVQDSALSAARAAARGPNARYALGHYQLAHGMP